MTHLPNELALKMDGAEACYPYPAVHLTSRVGGRVGGRGGCVKVLAVMPDGAASSADLGGSSKYSNAIFED